MGHTVTDTPDTDSTEWYVSTRPPDVLEAGRWWSIKEASEAFGMSAKTIRRRIKDGTLTAQRDDEDPTAAWTVRESGLIELYGEPKNPVTVTDTAAPKPTGEIVHLKTRITELEIEVQAQEIAAASALTKAKNRKKRIGKLNTELDELRRADKDVAVAAAVAEAEVEHLAERVAETRDERDQVRDANAALKEEIETLRTASWWRRRRNL
jgi:hypothetical protein